MKEIYKMKLSNQEIINYLSTNKTARKKVILSNIESVLKVNDLLAGDDISTIIHDSSFYDDLYSYDISFNDLLDDWYMSHLNIPENNNIVMCWLHYIYA